MAVNLERLRRLSALLERRHATVNIAGAEFRLVENGVILMHKRVIVGRTSRRTPELHGLITRVEANPYWNVPVRIARLDILPKIRRDSGYLARQGIRVLGSWGPGARELDPGAVDWSSGSYRLRQDPGPLNALGVVKFHIPNPYDVYLHDTPSKELFAKPERFFSSGCIRLEQPLELAHYLLQDAWPAFEAALASGRNTAFDLSAPLPIHVVYLTAWSDEAGLVQFRDDVYDRDREPAVAAVGASAALLAECTAAPKMTEGAPDLGRDRPKL
jgi:murein L,D-transpeptidase YcbB/YkuD